MDYMKRVKRALDNGVVLTVGDWSVSLWEGYYRVEKGDRVYASYDTADEALGYFLFEITNVKDRSFSS